MSGVCRHHRAECETPPVKLLLDDYCDYLRMRRGLAATTVQGRRDVARRFARKLTERDGELALDLVSVELVHEFVFGEAVRLKPSSLVNVLDNIRCLLRYAFATGQLDADLSGAVPRLHAARRRACHDWWIRSRWLPCWTVVTGRVRSGCVTTRS